MRTEQEIREARNLIEGSLGRMAKASSGQPTIQIIAAGAAVDFANFVLGEPNLIEAGLALFREIEMSPNAANN